MPLPRPRPERYVNPHFAGDDLARGQEHSYRDRLYEPWGQQGAGMPTFGGLREPGPESGWLRGSEELDAAGEPILRARGPKGYVRSDARIYEDVCEQLTEDADVDATDIHVEVERGEVSLRGSVPDRYTKRLAEDVANSVAGVVDVHNELWVARAVHQ